MTQTKYTEHLRWGVIGIIYIALLAGRFSLDRLGPEYDYLGILGQVRYALVLLSVVVFVAGMRHRDVPISLDPVMKRIVTSIIIAHLYLFASVTWTPDPIEGIDVALQAIMICILILLLAHACKALPQQSLSLLVSLIYWTAILYALGGLLGIGGPSSSPLDGEILRMYAFHGGPNVFVRIVGLGLFTGVFLYRKTRKIAWLFPAPLFAICAVLSGSRGGLFSLLVTFPFFLLFRPRAKKSWAHLLPAAGVILLGLFALAMFFDEANPIVAFWERRFEGTLREGYYSDRDVIFISAWKLFLEHPIIGVGITGFWQILGIIHEWDYPHNLILSVACEGGIIGIVLLAMPFRWIFFSRPKQPPMLSYTFYWCGLFFLAASMFSGSYYDTRMMWVLFTLGAFPLGNAEKAISIDSSKKQQNLIREHRHRWISRAQPRRI